MPQLRYCLGVVLALLAGMPAAPAWAQAAPPGSAPVQPAPEAPVASVDGYRSAHFGMTEQEVREAIAKDFGKDTVVKDREQLGEQTRLLTIKVADLIPQGGPAEISYVFGYKTHRLIQVGIVWSNIADPSLTPQRLLANAELLVAYFQGKGYKPGTVATNVPISDGVILFRGEDQQGRQTAVILRGTSTETNGQRSFAARILGVYYIADPQHPDVYRIRPGQF